MHLFKSNDYYDFALIAFSIHFDVIILFAELLFQIPYVRSISLLHT